MMAQYGTVYYSNWRKSGKISNSEQPTPLRNTLATIFTDQAGHGLLIRSVTFAPMRLGTPSLAVVANTYPGLCEDNLGRHHS